VNIAALPEYPSRPDTGPSGLSGANTPDPARERRSALVFKALLLMMFCSAAFHLRWTLQLAGSACDLAQPDFEMAARNYDRVMSGMRFGEVVALLGPPSGDSADPVLVHAEQVWKQHPRMPDVSPLRTDWKKWQDPENSDRWLAVYFRDDRVYMTLKQGD
jgi:hypothetical protein